MDSSEPDLEDSGCVQDVSLSAMEEPQRDFISLLDLSDDVLLCILQYCQPRDLKALGFTCSRLGRLICDRTLWTNIVEREHPTSQARLRWYLTHVVNESTERLCLTGYANRCNCKHSNKTKREETMCEDTSSNSDTEGQTEEDKEESESSTRHRLLNLPRMYDARAWLSSESDDVEDEIKARPWPRLTICRASLRYLRRHCPALHTLALDDCNIDCATTGLCHFPSTLKYLSLKGTKCYNLPIDKSFMFRIQDHLPRLVEVDVSNCAWMEGAGLLPLSKLPMLRKLVARECRRLSEFVAYASLSARYGFRVLKVLDVRGSPLGDSEVSALGWFPCLEELLLSPAAPPTKGSNGICRCDLTTPELDEWELEEPEYFKTTPLPVSDSEADANLESSMCHERTPERACTSVLTITFNRESAANRVRNYMVHQGLNLEERQENPPNKTRSRFEENPEAGPSTSKNEENGEASQKYVKFRRNQPPMVVFKKTGESSSSATGIDDSDNSQNNSHTENGAKEDKSEAKMKGKANKRKLEDDSSEDAAIDEATSPKRKTGDTEKTETDASLKESASENNSKPDSSEDSPKEGKSNDSKKEENSQANEPGSSKSNSEGNTSNEPGPSAPKYVKFRRNQPPVFIGPQPSSSRPQENPQNRENNRNPENNREDEDRNRFFCVNDGIQIHAVYQVSLENSRPVCRQLQLSNLHRSLRSLHRQIGMHYGAYSNQGPHIEPTALVTDSSLRRFGRSDGEDINYVRIGPDGAFLAGRGQEYNARPNKSRLRILVCTGFTGITNSSLTHLATAAPDLIRIDVRGTSVNEKGVEAFKSLRPDCEVLYGNIETEP